MPEAWSTIDAGTNALTPFNWTRQAPDKIGTYSVPLFSSFLCNRLPMSIAYPGARPSLDMKKGGTSDPGQRTNVSFYARLFFLIGVLSAIAIWAISISPWPKLFQRVFADGKLYSSSVTTVPDAQERSLWEEIASRMGVLGRIASLALFSWVSNASSTDPQDSFEFDCVALPYRLNDTNAPNTTISLSQYIPGGTVLNLTSVVNSTCLGTNTGPVAQKVSFDICRVAAYTKTSERSGIHYEIWMPRSWSGRFISHGNGGLSGCIAAMPLAGNLNNELTKLQVSTTQAWHIRLQRNLLQLVQTV